MLLFIHFSTFPNSLKSSISKHRMLLFIDIIGRKILPVNSFQNIVCYCLSLEVALSRHCIRNFKTSYVTVYLFFRISFNDSLSDFKTSYVTVYRCSLSTILSKSSISKHRMLLFITLQGGKRISHANFKTSYVTVYHIEGESWAFSRCNFKTSYVTVYHATVQRYYNYTTFQNIVCYCLSPIILIIAGIVAHFKTSYVTVYRRSNDAYTDGSSISKHRMLLFIRLLQTMTVSKTDFKTSYVTVYPFRTSISM